jgi:hypothetical protein
MRASVLLASSVFFVLSACSETGLNIEPPSNLLPQPASITGRVCHPGGAGWLEDALVYTNVFERDPGNPDIRRVVGVVQAFTDRDGYFQLTDLQPNTEYLVYVQYGNQIIDQQSYFLRSGEDLVLPEPPCFDPQAMNIAVVSGGYDNMQSLLEQMGFINYSIIDGNSASVLTQFVSDPENLAAFDVVFFNGGHVENGIFYDLDNPSNPVVSTVLDSLRDYVYDGGSVVASDWSYDVIERAWPGAIDFLGSGLPNEAQLGDYGVVDAAVPDASLAAFIGSSSVRIEFDLPVWPVIIGTESWVTDHLTANITYREGTETYQVPGATLLASFNGGRGRVGFSTFRVAANQSPEMRGIFQYILYNVTSSNN